MCAHGPSLFVVCTGAHECRARPLRGPRRRHLLIQYKAWRPRAVCIRARRSWQPPYILPGTCACVRLHMSRSTSHSAGAGSPTDLGVELPGGLAAWGRDGGAHPMRRGRRCRVLLIAHTGSTAPCTATRTPGGHPANRFVDHRLRVKRVYIILLEHMHLDPSNR